MKLFAAIISIYIIFLTALPCVDGQDEFAYHDHSITSEQADHSHNEADQCSPFCTCFCCTSPILTELNIIHINNYSVLEFKYSEFASDFVSSPYISIWQPPEAC